MMMVQPWPSQGGRERAGHESYDRPSNSRLDVDVFILACHGIVARGWVQGPRGACGSMVLLSVMGNFIFEQLSRQDVVWNAPSGNDTPSCRSPKTWSEGYLTCMGWIDVGEAVASCWPVYTNPIATKSCEIDHHSDTSS